MPGIKGKPPCKLINIGCSDPSLFSSFLIRLGSIERRIIGIETIQEWERVSFSTMKLCYKFSVIKVTPEYFGKYFMIWLIYYHMAYRQGDH